MTPSSREWDRVGVVVCRCEEVLGEEIASAIASGAATINDVKRYTRAGMGACQGTFCVPAIAVMVAEASEAGIADVAPMTARAPVRPIRLEALAELAEVDVANRAEETREERR